MFQLALGRREKCVSTIQSHKKCFFYYVAITLKMRCVLGRAGYEEKSKETSIVDILGFATLGNKNIGHLSNSYCVPGSHGSTGHH